MPKKKVVVIGGGTGTIAVLQRLKDYNDLDISVIVSMTDDGGSNAVIRDEFGLLPLSDLRKSIIALSEIENGILRELFVYRFSKGKGLLGHTLGNLMMMALSDITGSEMGAVLAASKLFRIKGRVIPVTLRNSELVATYENGNKIKGEHLIDEPDKLSYSGKITKLSLSKKVPPNPGAIKAIKEADFIIAGPGDLYTTTLATVIVPGVPRAISKSKGKFIFINNLMTKFGQTTGMSGTDLVKEITKYSGRTPDIVVVHKGYFRKDVLKKYAGQKELPIDDDFASTDYSVMRGDLVINSVAKRENGDGLKRSLIRHDSKKLGKFLYRIICNSNKK